ALILAIGNFIRPDAIVYLVPYLVYFFLQLLAQPLKFWRRNFAGFIIIIAVFTFTGSILSTAVKVNHINDVGMINPDPYNRLAVGLHLASNGRYSNDVNNQIKQLTQKQKYTRPQASLKITKDNLHTLSQTRKRDLLNFFAYKQALYAFGIFDGLNFPLGYFSSYHSFLYKLLSWLNSGYILIVFIFALVGFWKTDYRQQLLKIILPFIIFVGLFSNIFNEVQYRYSFAIQPIIFILASIGFNYLLNKVRAKINV
ncbi:hypothetical protein, partial [Bombilactobacillus bombi]|uniref:hypothetical protein n=1 Tax=Bombilactobacillus bombi TaxID=1303590 RepID=UPI0015E5DAC9